MKVELDEATDQITVANIKSRMSKAEARKLAADLNAIVGPDAPIV